MFTLMFWQRLLWEKKGLFELTHASRFVLERSPEASFLLSGHVAVTLSLLHPLHTAFTLGLKVSFSLSFTPEAPTLS